MLKNFLFEVCVCLAVFSTLQFCQSQISNQRAEATTSKRIGNPPNSESAVRAKDILDVRDYGVDCTFAHDSSAALNAITTAPATNGAAITFPPSCHVKLTSTWLVKNLSGFTIKGISGAGNNGNYGTNVPTITWTGAAGGTMIDMEYVDGFEVDHLAIDGGGLASIGINVDKTGGGGTVNTTDGLFNRLMVNANSAGAGNANWVGIKLAAISSSNVEDMRITNSTFFCGNSPTSGIAGIYLVSSFNVKNVQIEHNFIHDCNVGVLQTQGHANIRYNEVGSNHTDFEIDYYTDPEQISYNLSESAESGDKFLVLGVVGHVVEVQGNNIPINNTCAITFTHGGTVSSPNGNTFYAGYGGGVGGSRWCNGTGSTIAPTIIGGLANFDVGPADLAPFVSFFGNNPHPIVDTATVSNAPKNVILSTGANFETQSVHYGTNDAGGSRFAPANQTENATACGVNTICRDEGSEETGGPVTPDGIYCAVTGGTGTGGTHTWYVSAVDSLGNETILGNSGNSSGCTNTPGTYDSSHYETITWLPSPGAASYTVYAANPMAPGSQYAQVASGVTATSYQFNGPYPTSFTIGIKNLYNKALYRIFRGREVDLQFGTPLKGFSDKGVTQTFSLSSRGFQLGALGTMLTQMASYSTASITPAAVSAASCSDQTFPLQGVTTADRISNIGPPAALGNLSLNGYVSASNTLLLHFCNPSGSSAIPPAGVYSVLAVH
jgi:hypothetical protein